LTSAEATLPENPESSSYVVARKVLLDCLELLAPQSSALVLVGAQAIYLQTPVFDAGLPAYTTDGDLAIDPELLAQNPDLARVLEDAGFQPHSSPGRWFSPEGIPIDLMVPTGALPTSSRRTAPLLGQGAMTARRTAGLELALVDNSPLELQSLDAADTRIVKVNVASPAALVVAKLVKLAERLSDTRVDRVLAKDASDVLRLLRYNDAAAIGSSLGALAKAGAGSGTIQMSIDFLRTQLAQRTSSVIELAVEYHQGYETERQIALSFRTLGARLIGEYESVVAE
jgi:hypothetical protein